MKEFIKALVSKNKSNIVPAEHNLFGHFVGEWDFEWIDCYGTAEERHIKGEWIFQWILEGTAIQDVFICPSRKERLTNYQPDAAYGTTVRMYNPDTLAWDILYTELGGATQLEARWEKDRIVQTVVRCNGSCENRPRTALYDGAKSCAIAHATSGGETGCTFGCLGCGDCVEACQFDAIHMNPETGLPEVDEEKCTACGACSKACPRKIIEIRPKGKNNRRVVVMCVNKDKGAVANKACKASCIGCGKCVKVCPFEAITLENNLAYIDPAKCKSCRKCESECPKGAIQAINFPPRKPKVEVPAGEAAAKPAVKVEASKVETPKAEAVKAEAPKTEA